MNLILRMEILKGKFKEETSVYKKLINDLEYEESNDYANLYNYKVIYQKGSMTASLNTEFIIISGIYNDYILL